MIDFSNGSFFKLSLTTIENIPQEIAHILLENEEIISVYKAVRDSVIFTDKRIIAVNVQGMTGKKKDFTSIPYNKIVSFSIETSGTFDLDSELDIFISGVGKIRFEFHKSNEIYKIGKIISTYLLRD